MTEWRETTEPVIATTWEECARHVEAGGVVEYEGVDEEGGCCNRGRVQASAVPPEERREVRHRRRSDLAGGIPVMQTTLAYGIIHGSGGAS